MDSILWPIEERRLRLHLDVNPVKTILDGLQNGKTIIHCFFKALKLG